MKYNVIILICLWWNSIIGQHNIIHDALRDNILLYSLNQELNQNQLLLNDNTIYQKLDNFCRNERKYIFKITKINQSLIEYATVYLVDNPSASYHTDTEFVEITRSHGNALDNKYIIAINNENGKLYFLSGNIFTSSLSINKEYVTKKAIEEFILIAFYHHQLSKITLCKKRNENYIIKAYSKRLNKKVKIKFEKIINTNTYHYYMY